MSTRKGEEQTITDEEIDRIFSEDSLREGERAITAYYTQHLTSQVSTSSSPVSSFAPFPPSTRKLPALTPEEGKRLYTLHRAAMLVYQLILLQCRYCRGASVVLRAAFTRGYGISHDSRTRALLSLQNAGFITLTAVRGGAPIITLIEPLRQEWIAQLGKRTRHPSQE